MLRLISPIGAYLKRTCLNFRLLAIAAAATLVVTGCKKQSTPPSTADLAGYSETSRIATATSSDKPQSPSDLDLGGDTIVVVKVDPTKVVRPIPRALFGTNLEWFNYATGLSSAEGVVDPAWPLLAKEQGVDNIRFPGGTLSDFYHWRDGIGPISRRPVRDHWTDEGQSPNVFGTPELLRFSRDAGARPLITVNAGTADAAEAAAWVAYCNTPGHPERTADGFPQPAGIQLWEVGNELYLPGNPHDKKIITVKPEVYATRFLEFSRAMRAVDPTIKVIAIGTANATTVTLPYPTWNDVLLRAAADEMDYLAVHNAYFPMIFGKTGLGYKEVYQSLWAAPEAVSRSLKDLDAMISRNEKSRRIEIAITEWGALFSMDKYWVDHVKTMGTAVYVARLMQVFLEQPRVTLANYFKFADRTFMGWVGYDKKPKPAYFALQLFSRYFGTRLVETSVQSPTYNIHAVGVMTEEKGVPEVTAVSSLDDSGKTLYVNLINRSWSTVHQVKLETGSFSAAPQAVAWELSAPGVTDHNGRDLPPEVPTDLYAEPVKHPNAKAMIQLEQKTIDSSALIKIPPYSILTIQLKSRS